MIYHIDVTNGVLSVDRDDSDNRSIKQYFADRLLHKIKPVPVKVKGYPFSNMYLTCGNEENGSFVAVKSRVK